MHDSDVDDNAVSIPGWKNTRWNTISHGLTSPQPEHQHYNVQQYGIVLTKNVTKGSQQPK